MKSSTLIDFKNIILNLTLAFITLMVTYSYLALLADSYSSMYGVSIAPIWAFFVVLDEGFSLGLVPLLAGVFISVYFILNTGTEINSQDQPKHSH